MNRPDFLNVLFVAVIVLAVLCFSLWTQLLSARSDLDVYVEEISNIAHWRYEELLDEYDYFYERCEDFLESTGEARGYYELFFELSPYKPSEEYGGLIDEDIQEWVTTYEQQKADQREYERNH